MSVSGSKSSKADQISLTVYLSDNPNQSQSLSSNTLRIIFKFVSQLVNETSNLGQTESVDLQRYRWYFLSNQN